MCAQSLCLCACVVASVSTSLCLFLCLCTYVFVRVCVFRAMQSKPSYDPHLGFLIFRHTYTHTYTLSHAQIHVYTHTRTHIHTHTHTYKHGKMAGMWNLFRGMISGPRPEWPWIRWIGSAPVQMSGCSPGGALSRCCDELRFAVVVLHLFVDPQERSIGLLDTECDSLPDCSGQGEE
jgi:hypothetical protein